MHVRLENVDVLGDNKKSFSILNGYSEAVNRKMSDNTMSKINRTKNGPRHTTQRS